MISIDKINASVPLDGSTLYQTPYQSHIPSSPKSTRHWSSADPRNRAVEAVLTRHHVPRGALPDAETIDKLLLVKNVSSLRATYQIRLLTFAAENKRKRLILKVPPSCRFEPSLKAFIKSNSNLITRENM